MSRTKLEKQKIDLSWTHQKTDFTGQAANLKTVGRQTCIEKQDSLFSYLGQKLPNAT